MTEMYGYQHWPHPGDLKTLHLDQALLALGTFRLQLFAQRDTAMDPEMIICTPRPTKTTVRICSDGELDDRSFLLPSSKTYPTNENRTDSELSDRFLPSIKAIAYTMNHHSSLPVLGKLARGIA